VTFHKILARELPFVRAKRGRRVTLVYLLPGNELSSFMSDPQAVVMIDDNLSPLVTYARTDCPSQLWTVLGISLIY
jgi:hypothetical protein